MIRMLTVLLAIVLSPWMLFAQVAISGKIAGADDHHPLPHASVFINNTTIGTNADLNGNFKLTGIKPGKYEVVVSIIGYNTARIAVTVAAENIELPIISLSAKVNTLQEVTISSRQDPDREKYLEIFQSVFLGNSERAKQCKITNPELLDFEYDSSSGILSGKSVDFLIIENRSLGYRIKYLLTDFRFNQKSNQFSYEGTDYFEPLQAPDLQINKWNSQREQIYQNTVEKFLKAAVENKLAESGFTVYRFPYNPERASDSTISLKITQFSKKSKDRHFHDSLSYWEKQEKLPKLLLHQKPVMVTAAELISRYRKNMYTFSCSNDGLFVVYKSERQHANPGFLIDNTSPNTLVTFNQPMVYFDADGRILNAGSLSYQGEWANQRVAELLPADFQPEHEDYEDKTLHRKLDSLLNQQSFQKVYLQFDKTIYAAGDTVYFKAYMWRNGSENEDTETQLHVDLLQETGQRLGKTRLKIKEGGAAGDFVLPDTLLTDNLHLVAFNESYQDCRQKILFETNIPVAGGNNSQIKIRKVAVKRNVVPIPKHTDSVQSAIDVQFFPEGGNLVNGVDDNIAFKAVDRSGKGIDISGKITDDAGNQVCSFKSRHLGMGEFQLKPESGKSYRATVFWDDQHAICNLPKGNDTGYQLNIITGDRSQLKINIAAARNTRPGRITIIGESSGRICYFESPELHGSTFNRSILTDILPAGIIRFTLFSDKSEPMNERMVFVRKAPSFNLAVAGLQKQYQARAKATLRLSCTDAAGKADSGRFSISVVNNNLVPEWVSDENTIFTQYFLKSELSGYIEQPAWYFTEAADADTNLDGLLLTQGYREFQWKPLLDNRSASCPPPVGTVVSGVIKNQKGKPIGGIKVSMTSVTTSFFSIDTVADKNGKFVFEHYPVDGMRYIIQATDQKIRKNTLIELNDLKPVGRSQNVSPDSRDTVLSRQLKDYANADNRFLDIQMQSGFGKHSILLKEVIIKERMQKKIHASANLNGAGYANDVITGDEMPIGCSIFKDCIASHLHGIKYRDGNFYFEFATTLVIVDGVEIPSNIKFSGLQVTPTDGPSQADILDLINPRAIATVEILRDASYAAIYGSRGSGGIIIVTTKNGWEMGEQFDDQRISYQYYSPLPYFKARVFYSPKYLHPQTMDKQPDLRTTAYWNPDVSVNSSHDGTVEFFNPDTKGTYRIVIEGVDNQGNPGRAIYNYNVD